MVLFIHNLQLEGVLDASLDPARRDYYSQFSLYFFRSSVSNSQKNLDQLFFFVVCFSSFCFSPAA